MPVLNCPVPLCLYQTADVGDTSGTVFLKHHLDSEHSSHGRGSQEPTPKIQINRPCIKAGASTDDWSHFSRDWQTYKDVCRLTSGQANKVLLECCDEDLKHLMYGQFTQERQSAATEEQLAALKKLAVACQRPHAQAKARRRSAVPWATHKQIPGYPQEPCPPLQLQGPLHQDWLHRDR